MVKCQDSDTESDGERCFRVSVSMERYYPAPDQRSHAFVSVKRVRRVRWLQQRLSRLFGLPPRMLLMCQGHLLPACEPLAVLEPGDQVDVLPHAGFYDNPLSAQEVPCSPDELSESKRSALSLLDQVAGRPRRRRVRRRRPQSGPPASAAGGPADGPAGPDGPDGPAGPDGPDGPREALLVLRNELQPRAPRIVRALDDEITATGYDKSPVEIDMNN